MIDNKNIRAVAIFSVLLASYSAPVHACSLHGEFGMQRFNPFQAGSYDNSSSWAASLNQPRKMSPIPETPDTDEEPAEETWIDKPQVDDQESVSNGTQIGRRNDENGLDQALTLENGQDDEQQNLISASSSDSETDKAMFH